MAAGLAAFACKKAEDVEVPVTMTIDTASCTTEEPDFVELTCPTAVGLTLWGDESADRLQSVCLDLPGTDRTLVALPPLLDTVDLSTMTTEPVRLEMGLFAPRAASDGCPDVSENHADMLLKGDTEPTDLSSTVRGLAVTIVCVSVESSEEITAWFAIDLNQDGRCDLVAYRYWYDTEHHHGVHIWTSR